MLECVLRCVYVICVCLGLFIIQINGEQNKRQNCCTLTKCEKYFHNLNVACCYSWGTGRGAWGRRGEEGCWLSREMRCMQALCEFVKRSSWCSFLLRAQNAVKQFVCVAILNNNNNNGEGKHDSSSYNNNNNNEKSRWPNFTSIVKFLPAEGAGGERQRAGENCLINAATQTL